MSMRLVAALLLTFALLAEVDAANPGERLADPVLEERARELSKELRCLVCQNQSIDDSDADLAKDLRVLVRERLTAGDSDDEILTYLTDRYGAFVRLRPPVGPQTLVLWVTPFLVGLLALVSAAVYLRRRRVAPAAAEPLSKAEEAELSDRLARLKR